MTAAATFAFSLAFLVLALAAGAGLAMIFSRALGSGFAVIAGLVLGNFLFLAIAILREVAMGLFVTLGNSKPILFYGALMPTLLDTSKIGIGDFVVLGSIVVVISFLVYGGYMLLLARARRLIGSAKAVKRLNQATGVMFVGSGILVATR